MLGCGRLPAVAEPARCVIVLLQVIESLPRNSGRDRVPVFIYRQKVPRAVEPVPRPGDIAKQTVLNVFGDLIDGYFILDRLKVISN